MASKEVIGHVALKDIPGIVAGSLVGLGLGGLIANRYVAWDIKRRLKGNEGKGQQEEKELGLEKEG